MKATILTEVNSQQLDSKGNPIVGLIKGDELELREDGIYFTRKIILPEGANLTRVFNVLTSENVTKESV